MAKGPYADRTDYETLSTPLPIAGRHMPYNMTNAIRMLIWVTNEQIGK
jgi:hypothetical protein